MTSTSDARPATPPRVKICGLTRRGDAAHAARAGADYLGVVVSDGFARSVPAPTAAGIVSDLDVPVVAVTVDEPAGRLVQLADHLGAAVVQLHGDESPDVVASLRDAGAWRIWKAVRARSVDDLERAVDRFGAGVDAYLVEGWRAGETGGAGLVLRVDPAEVRGRLPAGVDFVLAGGLRPETVADAVARFRPDVVDVSSGVEDRVGQKNPARVAAFIEAAGRATLPPSDPSHRTSAP